MVISFDGFMAEVNLVNQLRTSTFDRRPDGCQVPVLYESVTVALCHREVLASVFS